MRGGLGGEELDAVEERGIGDVDASAVSKCSLRDMPGVGGCSSFGEVRDA